MFDKKEIQKEDENKEEREQDEFVVGFFIMIPILFIIGLYILFML